MASIYKKSRDKGRKGACWYISYVDHNGRRRTKKGFTDKGLTEQLAAKLENEVMLRKRGLIDAEAENLANQRKALLSDVLPLFEESISENTQKHIRLIMGRVERVVEGCGFETLGDINCERVEVFMKKFRKQEEIGHRTYNHYIEAIEQFCLWCIRTKRLAANPMAGARKLNNELDVRKKRRALTGDEFAMLLKSARESPKSIQCYDGETRARIYTISVLTGLRRKEVAALSLSSFDLESEPPILTVEATTSKHRKKDVLPVHPELARLIQEWFGDLGPNDVFFPKLAKRRTWLMAKKDLEAVGIPYETPEGTADFHAAGRHTYITELFRNGASVTEARELARHSDVKMTMKYTHIGLKDQANALANVPAPKILPADDADETTPAEPIRAEPDPSPAESKQPLPPTEHNRPENPDWQRLGSAAGVSNGHLLSSGGGSSAANAAGQKHQNPRDCEGCGVDCHDSSPDSGMDEHWRRRESNPRPVIL